MRFVTIQVIGFYVQNDLMRIGINGRAFSGSQPDGAAQTGIKITQALSQINDFDIFVYGPESVGRWFDDVALKSELALFENQIFGTGWERTVLPLLAHRDNIDILICPNGNAPLTEFGSFKTIMYIHDVNALKGMSSPIHEIYRRLAVPKGAQASDMIITISDFSKREILDHISIPSEKVEVVYNGVNELYLGDEPGDPFELPNRYILYVGAMNPRKNVGSLVEAYNKLISNYNFEHKLVLIGPENKMLYENLDINISGSKIVTPGFVSEEKLKFAYENSDLFVYPSIYEGFGLPPLEAMACGSAVVASNVASLPEVLDDAAEFVNPNNIDDIVRGMSEVLSDESKKRELVRKGKSRSQQFTWEKAAHTLKQKITTLVNTKYSENDRE